MGLHRRIIRAGEIVAAYNTSNRVTRSQLFIRIDAMQPGEQLEIARVAKEMSTKRRFLDVRSVAGIIRERDDVERIRKGLWRKI